MDSHTQMLNGNISVESLRRQIAVGQARGEDTSKLEKTLAKAIEQRDEASGRHFGY